ncbi:MAG: hypothetical protein M3N52_11870 [Actinomycetota bacterium]|nr:hypothetical protein [Actinomycetota bacterium]
MTDPHAKALRLGGAVLHHQMGRRTDKARYYLQRLSDECGPAGIHLALLGWCDTLAAHAYGSSAPPRIGAGISLMRADTGQLDTADSQRVPPKFRWAARLIEARAAMDEGRYNALIEELPGDRAEVAEYVFAVASMAAWTINGLPKGYGRMGQGVDLDGDV